MQGDREELIKWHDVLDSMARRYENGPVDWVKRARECRHPTAVWFSSLFPAGDAPVTKDQVVAAVAGIEDDPRALFIRIRVADRYSFAPQMLLRRAAELGYAPAQAYLAYQLMGTEEGLVLAERAAAQGDRMGMFILAQCCLKGEGCLKDEVRGRWLLREAAELRQPEAMYELSKTLPEGPERYRLLGLAAARGHEEAALWLQMAAGAHCEKIREPQSAMLVFLVSQACEGHVDVISGTVFGSAMMADDCKGIQLACERHREWSGCAKRAVECWIAVGRRLGVVRDVRQLIARLVWAEPWAWAMTAGSGEEHSAKP